MIVRNLYPEFINLRVLILVVGIVLTISCRKDPEIINYCPELPPAPNYGWNTIDSSKARLTCINPYNPDEIIFKYTNTANSDLFKYNVLTKAKTVVYSGMLADKPFWGKNNWILLNLPDFNVYRILSNGDSLTQLTFTGHNYNPRWDYNCERIMFKSVDGANSLIYLVDFNGLILDSIKGGDITAGSCWNHPIYIASLAYPGINLYDTYNHRSFNVYSLPGYNHATGLGITFSGLNEIIWSNSSGIYKTLIKEKETKLIRKTCGAEIYLFPSYSPVGDKILWEKLIYTAKGDILIGRTKLIITNSSGTDEKEIQVE